MKKIIFIFIWFFIFSTSIFASSNVDDIVPTDEKSACQEVVCYENQIKKLIDVNEKLQEENKILSQQYEEFKKPLDRYIEILAESKSLSDSKSDAYDRALNDFNFWFKIFWWIIAILGLWFGFKSWPEFKKNIKDEIQELVLAKATNSTNEAIERSISSMRKEQLSYLESISTEIIDNSLVDKISKIKTDLLKDIDIEWISSRYVNNALNEKLPSEINKYFSKEFTD